MLIESVFDVGQLYFMRLNGFIHKRKHEYCSCQRGNLHLDLAIAQSAVNA
jgi:hypothetical protein